MKFEQFALRQPGGDVEQAANCVFRYMRETGYKPVAAMWADLNQVQGTGIFRTERLYGNFNCLGVKR